MADRRRSSFLGLTVDAAFLAGLEDLRRLERVIAQIALAHKDPLDLATGQAFGFVDHLLQDVAIVRMA